MPSIWAAISAHGFGHAAQVVPVLNALGHLVPDLHAVLRTTVPASFFKDRLTVPWERSAVQQDVGCIQDGPLKIDEPATWDAHARFHDTWDARVAEEAAAMRSAQPRVVLADTPYLASEAGARAGVPAVALANFTWDEILSRFPTPARMENLALIEKMRASYRQADLALRIAPGLPMNAFRKVVEIGPIAEPATSQRTELRAQLNTGERDRVVLVGFGGIPLTSFPWDCMERMTGYQFLVDGALPPGCARVHSIADLPCSFKTLLASIDLVMTKPGYGTVVEAVALGVPVVYVRRHTFADEQPLVDFLHRYGRASELSLDDFLSGRWQPALESAFTHPAPACPPPPPTGALDAAELLAAYF